MYYVKVEGKTLADLKAGLERHLDELSGYGTAKEVSVKTNKKTTSTSSHDPELHSHGNEADDDGMIDVESPFANTAPTMNTNTVIDNEVDAEGIPWDKRIHSSSKAKVKNGTWKIARGVSDEQANPIKAELKARVASAPAAAKAHNDSVVQNLHQLPPQQTYQAPQQVLTPAAQPVQQPVYQAPAIPKMTSGHTLETFKNNFALVIANLITEGKLTQDYVNQLNQYFQIQQIWQANAEQIEICFNQFTQAGLIQRVG
jgi:hypothetical protein